MKYQDVDASSPLSHGFLSTADDYRVDIGTLENISMISAQNKKVELNLLVWDLVELFGYEPTECLFEDVILAFGGGTSDQNLFAALVDMEKNGFVPSRVLLYRIAVTLSRNKGRLRHARKLLTSNEVENAMTTSSMNSLLLGFGMRKDLDSAFNIFDDFFRYGIRPDANTFSFLMEALYLDTKERFSAKAPDSVPDEVEDVLGAIEIVLNSMRAAGVEKSSHLIHEHVRLLCVVGKVEEAKIVLDEAIANRTRVSMGSIVSTAMSFARSGNFEMARTVAGLTDIAGCGKPPTYLIPWIDNVEKNDLETSHNQD